MDSAREGGAAVEKDRGICDWGKEKGLLSGLMRC